MSTPTLTRRQVNIVFVGAITGSAASAMGNSIVATAAPTIASDLGGFRLLPWIATSYLLTQLASIPIYGKLGDLFGRQRMFVISCVVFTAGAFGCGVADNMGQLIVARAFTGFGGGGLTALAMAILADMVSLDQRGRYISYSGIVYAVGSLIGPLVGGIFTDQLSWRWAFWFNVPVGLVAIALVRRYRVPHTARDRPTIDYLGAALVMAATTALVLFTSWGGIRYAWTSPTIASLAAATAICIGLLVAWQRRAPEPLLPPRLFADRDISLAMMVQVLGAIGFFVGIYFIPVFFQTVHGLTPTRSGVWTIGYAVTTSMGTAASAWLARRLGRYKPLPLAGLTLMAGGFWMLATLDERSANWEAFLYSLVVGLGVGLTLQLQLLFVQSRAPARDVGVATSTCVGSRVLGGLFGLAIWGTILNNRLNHELVQRLPESARGLNVRTLRAKPRDIAALEPAVRAAVIDSFAHALSFTFRAAIPAVAVAFALMLALREKPATARAADQ